MNYGLYDKCYTCGKSVKDRNSIKCKPCQTKEHLKCTYLNYVDSQFIKFSNKTWNCYNCSKTLLPFTTINNYMLYQLLCDKNYCNNDSNDSCLSLKSPKILPTLISDLIKFHLVLLTPQKMYLIQITMILSNCQP